MPNPSVMIDRQMSNTNLGATLSGKINSEWATKTKAQEVTT